MLATILCSIQIASRFELISKGIALNECMINIVKPSLILKLNYAMSLDKLGLTYQAISYIEDEIFKNDYQNEWGRALYAKLKYEVKDSEWVDICSELVLSSVDSDLRAYLDHLLYEVLQDIKQHLIKE